ncbi:MAG: NADH-quinone oxidoreductase subunit C [Gemmatimonadales bacterium]|nr:NADH-quinone oxidoreductase subunit C [Gemmatimonadales bacterium]
MTSQDADRPGLAGTANQSPTARYQGVVPDATMAPMRERFGAAIERVVTSCGQSSVYVAAHAAHAVLEWLRDDPSQQFNYLTDLTCVEYRDPELPFEVVYQLRSLTRSADLRVKIALDGDGPLEVASVVNLWIGANWLEREAYDMFGVVFRGHPDLRRILMWDGYQEGHPLRKSFPLRGRFSRAEQTRQALAANPEAHYSMEELSIAEAYGDLPRDMQERLAAGEHGVVR